MLLNDDDGGCGGECGGGCDGGVLRLIFLDQNHVLSSASHNQLSGNGCPSLFWQCGASCATQYARVCCEATDASLIRLRFHRHSDSKPARANRANACTSDHECGRVRPMNDDDV